MGGEEAGAGWGAGQAHHRPIADHDQPQREGEDGLAGGGVEGGQVGGVGLADGHQDDQGGGGDQPGLEPLLGLAGADLAEGVGFGVDGGGQVVQHLGQVAAP